MADQSGTSADNLADEVLQLTSGGEIQLINGTQVTHRCRLTKSANQTLSDDTKTTLTFDTEAFDVGGMHDNATNNSRITIPSGGDGIYLVGYLVVFNANSTGRRLTNLGKNGSDIALELKDATSAGGASLEFTTLLSLSATDYLEVFAEQESGGSLDVLSSLTEFWAVRVL